jgi:hypothetical protein
MLKIALTEMPTQCLVVLEGRMVGTGIKRRALVIDIKGVWLISQEGENALLQLINHGAKFRPDGALAKLILQQLAHRSNRQLRDLIDEAPSV